MSKTKLKPSDISIGKPIPWAAYDGNGALLLNKGYVIQSQHQLDILLDRGLYRNKEEGEQAEETTAPVHNEHLSPFTLLDDLASRLRVALSDQHKTGPATDTQVDFADRIRRIAKELIALTETSPDACLGAVHLWRCGPYSIHHMIHAAILSCLIAQRLSFERQQLLTLTAASLTQNLSILELHDQLVHQPGRLNPLQRIKIDSHPVHTRRMLKDRGVNDDKWLDMVYSHHECADGSGYPQKLSGNDLLLDSQIIALCDRYAAMISSRSYRKALQAKYALRELFVDKRCLVHEKLVLTFIKELGVYPPGSFVKLENGETAVVTNRGEKETWPIVHSILSPRAGLTQTRCAATPISSPTPSKVPVLPPIRFRSTCTGYGAN